MTFTRILCPTDFSPGSAQALRVAIRIARESAAELVLFHAWHVPATVYAIESSFPPPLVEGIVADARRALDAAVQEAVAAGVQRVTSTLVAGPASVQIIDELENPTYDLCVIGTHGRTGLERVLVGSVAEKVVRHSPCSVLVVRPDGEVRPFRHALVPTDFSDSATHALQLATQLVKPLGEISVLHVTEVPVTYGGEFDTDFIRDLDKRAAAALDKVVDQTRRTTSVMVRERARLGSPGRQILAALDDDRSFDLVVMGSHGRTGIQRALLGSVAEKVVRHGRCPVLVARRRA